MLTADVLCLCLNSDKVNGATFVHSRDTVEQSHFYHVYFTVEFQHTIRFTEAFNIPNSDGGEQVSQQYSTVLLLFYN